MGVQWTLSIFTQQNHYDFFSTFSWLWQILKPNQELLRKLLPSDYRKYIDESYLYSQYFMKIYSPAAKYDDLWGLGCAVFKTDLILWPTACFKKDYGEIFEVRRTFCEKWELGQRMELYQLAQCALGELLIDSVPHCTLGWHFLASSWIGTYRKSILPWVNSGNGDEKIPLNQICLSPKHGGYVGVA